jgi:hypothetical protein
VHDQQSSKQVLGRRDVRQYIHTTTLENFMVISTTEMCAISRIVLPIAPDTLEKSLFNYYNYRVE